MSETTDRVDVSETKDGRWQVTIFGQGDTIEEQHTLDVEPSVASIKALIQDARTHKDALARLVYR